MTEQNLYILNRIPLVDVMRGWGIEPMRISKTGATALYLCPWHDDHHPSLVVDRVRRDGAEDLGFKCFACGQEGYGAIQLAARLMGEQAGRVSKEMLSQVLHELATRCEVRLEQEGDEKYHYDTLRTSIVGWSEIHQQPRYAEWTGEQPIFERGEWTEEGLKALGLKVELATRKARKSDISANATSGRGTAELCIGDLLTQYDADTGLPLYRCSLDRSFYRDPRKAEVKTIAAWGAELERLFGVEPVARFIQRVEPKKGGVAARVVNATKNYPIFMFRYTWGIKKYEPKDSFGASKWTWWGVSEDADLYHQWYADAALTDVLEGAVPEQDALHPFVAIGGDKEKDDKPKKIRFERVVLCSGPRDAIAVYSHSNAHVVWLHSEQAGFTCKGGNMRPDRWLRSFIRKLLGVTVEGGLYVCYDEDNTGLTASQAIALNNPQVRWLRLPKELGRISVGKADGRAKVLKDVTDFVSRFNEVEARMPADLQHDDPVDWFDNALFDTPSCQFWQWESNRKEQDGSERARYKFDLRNAPVFLRARGMVRQEVQQEGEKPFSRFFLLGNDNTYSELFTGINGNSKLVAQCRDLMAEWLRAHKEFNDAKGALSRAIYSAKMEQGTLENIEMVDFDIKSFGDDFDHFFFENTAVKVTAKEITPVPYSSMRWWTNSDAILKGRFEPQVQMWHVELSQYYEPELKKHEAVLEQLTTPAERAQENMRWDQWVHLWKYRLVMDKPLDEMPLHFRFLYNTARIFWDKEVAGGDLTTTEKQAQDMYFIAMLHAIGSALVRQRSASRQQFVHITDNGTRREDLASGGTGKTAILEMLSLVRRVLSIDGKSLEGSNITLEQELGKVVPGIHSIVCVDELPAGFSPKKMYNLPLSVTSRGLYKSSVTLRGDDLPKFVVASNEQIDLSSDSTLRRTYQVLVSDWYHPRSIDGSRLAHTPADDFRKQYGIKEVARNLPASLLNEARNLLLGCVQLYFQMPDETLTPPKDSRALLRQALASSKDEQFTRWIASYLADNKHIGLPIAQRELAISLLDYCGITVGEKTINAAYKRIRDNLDDYLRTSIYVANPPVVLLTPTDRENGIRQCRTWQYPHAKDGTILTDDKGNRLPRELKTSKAFYFYPKGRVPRNFYDPEHVGDKDYVQAAPECDPEN